MFTAIEVVDRLLQKLDALEEGTHHFNEEPLRPWYRHFRGEFVPKGKDSYMLGRIQKEGKDKIVVSELPIGVKTDNFRERLNKQLLSSEGELKLTRFTEQHTDRHVHFELRVPEEEVDNWVKPEILVDLGLRKLCSSKNMHLFNSYGAIKRYQTAEDILDEFFEHRLALYTKRKAHQLHKIAAKKRVAENKARFIESVVQGQLALAGRSKSEIISDVVAAGFDANAERFLEEVDVEDVLANHDLSVETNKDQFDYLLRMPLTTLSAEQVKSLRARVEELEKEENSLKRSTESEVYRRELLELRTYLVAMEVD
ncbi:MAG: hypothetical protein MHM6MM_004864 [Cercozoa sp. M6MM]